MWLKVFDVNFTQHPCFSSPFLERGTINLACRNDFAVDTSNERALFSGMYIAKITSLYSYYLEPKLTKENLYKTVSETISFSTYYAMVPSVGQTDTELFLKRTSISIGFKLFSTVVTPVIAQFVESFVEVNTHSVKYTYYSIKCVFDIKYCDETNTLSEPLNILQDFFQFDMLSYSQKLSAQFSKLTPEGVLLNGLISAAASEIKDQSFIALGFDQYCQGNICKNYLSYYYKEWIKNEIKSSLSTSTEQEADLRDNHSEIFPKMNQSMDYLKLTVNFSVNIEQICQDDLCQTSIVYSMIDSDKNQMSISSIINLGHKIHANDVIDFNSGLNQSNLGDTSAQLATLFLNQSCPVLFSSATEGWF